MLVRFLLALGVALALQGTVFAMYYEDLLFLRQSPERIRAGTAGTFARHAQTALARPKLTVRHLDTIGEAASAWRLHELEISALERRLALTPDEWRVRAQLADAHRRAGNLPRAEALYRDLLEAPERTQP